VCVCLTKQCCLALHCRFEPEKPKSNANDIFAIYEHNGATGQAIKPTPAHFEPPAAFDNALCQWAGYLCDLGHGTLTDTMIKNRHAAPFIQVLLLAVHKNAQSTGDASAADTGNAFASKALDKLCSTILPLAEDKDVAAAPDRYGFLAKHEFGSRVLEVLLRCTGNAHFALLHKHAARPTFAALSRHHISNFVVQKYLENIRDSSQARSIIGEFIPKDKTKKAANDDAFRCKFDCSIVLATLQVGVYLCWHNGFKCARTKLLDSHALAG